MLHELATNASKHGGLSTRAGSVEIVWSADPNRPAAAGLARAWQAARLSSTRRGFGSLLLDQVVRQQLAGELATGWHEAGLHCRIGLPQNCFTGSFAPASPAVPAQPLAALGTSGRRVLVVEDRP